MRFNGFKWSVAKIILAIVLGLITFWPQYGVIFLATNNVQEHPFIVLFLLSLWVIILALIFPLPLRWFSHITTFAWIFLFLVIDFVSYQAKFLDPSQPIFYIIGIIEVFAIFGWLMCVSPLWRVFHGVVAVQQTPEEEHHQ